MLNCPVCQHQNADTAKFCRDCGSALAQPAAADPVMTAADEWGCDDCGKQNPAAKKFCTGCGRPKGIAIVPLVDVVVMDTPQDIPSSSVTPAATPPVFGKPAKPVPVVRPIWMWLVVGLAVVVITIVAIAYSMTHGKKELPASQVQEVAASQIIQAGGVVDSSNAPAQSSVPPAVPVEPVASQPSVVPTAESTPTEPTAATDGEGVASKPSKTRSSKKRVTEENSDETISNSDSSGDSGTAKQVNSQKAAVDSATARLKKQKEIMLEQINKAQ